MQRGEWSSGLRRYDENWNVPGSNPSRCLARLRDPTLLRGPRWLLGQNNFGSLLANKPQIKIFPKKSFQSILSFMLLLLYEKKNQKSYEHQFSTNHEKSHFGVILDPILPENPITRFFLKGSLKYILRLYVVLTSSKRSAKLAFGPKILGLNYFQNKCNITSNPWQRKLKGFLIK